MKAKDFAEWLRDPDHLVDLSVDIGANWALVKRFLISALEKHGFYVLSEREIEALKECDEE